METDDIKKILREMKIKIYDEYRFYRSFSMGLGIEYKRYTALKDALDIIDKYEAIKDYDDSKSIFVVPKSTIDKLEKIIRDNEMKSGIDMTINTDPYILVKPKQLAQVIFRFMEKIK